MPTDSENPYLPPVRKYCIGNIEEQNGEYDYITTIRFITEDEPTTFLEIAAKNWYKEGSVEFEYDRGTYYFHGCKIGVKPGWVKEVTRDVYYSLDIIADMTDFYL